MLVIRYRRTGKRSKPTYRIVVAEHSWPVGGKFIADLGFYNPHTKVNGLNLDEAKVWLDKGAQPSNSVAKVMVKEKLKHGSVEVIKKNKKPRKPVEEAAKKAETAPVDIETPEVSAETPESTEVEAPTESAPEEVPAES
jgi:small subunit ribosomal protein S16